MAWLQLRVLSTHPEFAEEVMLAHDASAVSFVDAEDNPVLEPAPGETPLWSNTVTLGLFVEDTDLAPVTASLRELLPDGATAELKTELIEDQDWVRLWLKDCPPLKFGENLWVVPHQKLHEVTDPGATIIKLDPGLAFGTGTHPTTALCLEWLAGQNLHGKQVLDFGCGSGILAIGALKLGAAGALGVDIDPQALTASQQNARDNGVAGQLRTLLPEEFVPFPADIVVANILANPLVQLAPLLASTIARGGRIAMAGLLERQADEVRSAYTQWLDFDDDVVKDGWTRLSATCRMPALIAFQRISPTLATAGQPRPEHFPTLAKAGYKAVINLAMPASPNFLTHESELCASNGLEYFHLPVDWNAPTTEHLQAFFSRMDALSGHKVFVHCALNKRVSVFTFLYRVIKLGESVDVASQDLHRIWQPNEIWQSFLDRSLLSM
jgi:ribosomal protein L11 methyltransferase